MSTYPAKNRKHPGRQFIVLARLLRAGEELPLVMGKGHGRELDLIKGMLREGRPMRVTCESLEDARSLKQSLGQWRVRYRRSSPLIERLRIQDTDGGTVLLAFFLSPLIDPQAGREYPVEPRKKVGRKRPEDNPQGPQWTMPENVQTQAREANELAEEEDVDRFE